MPRAPLTLISGNRPRKGKLTLYERGIIVGAQALGHKPTEIERLLISPNRPFRTLFKDSPSEITACPNHDLGGLRCFLTAIDVISSGIRELIHGSPVQSCSWKQR